jgi:sRNA-binding regulator protein Hfq
MNEVMTAEEEFFAALIKSNREAEIFLLSGIKLKAARVLRESEFCILLQMNAARGIPENTSLVYKSAIASVVPSALGEQARRGSKVMRETEENTA